MTEPTHELTAANATKSAVSERYRKEWLMKRIEDRGDLAGWKAGLLARIQERGVEHSRLLYQGYPHYDRAIGGGNLAIHTWRANLRELAAEQQELILRAETSGIPRDAIYSAVDNGDAGRRWGEAVTDPPTIRHGDAPARAHLIAAIAEDVWRLEYMAVIAVAREERHRGDSTDAAADLQYLYNMDSLYERVDCAAALAEPTESERDELWDRDVSGWYRLAELTVDGYDDTELETAWRVHAWEGFGWEVYRGIDDMARAARSAVIGRVRPPVLMVLFEHARAALTDLAEAKTQRWLKPIDQGAWDDPVGEVEP
ncbi:hypothetical protein ACWEKT_20770 [Nocardia takedensis]